MKVKVKVNLMTRSMSTDPPEREQALSVQDGRAGDTAPRAQAVVAVEVATHDVCRETDLGVTPFILVFRLKFHLGGAPPPPLFVFPIRPPIPNAASRSRRATRASRLPDDDCSGLTQAGATP